ncbi:hypothetical protein L7F22_048870 [Adiantum nelumboides]|nr:hypothetical protein [Adiantum nelumboides]
MSVWADLMSDRQLPIVASSNSTSSPLVGQWQQHQLPPQQVLASNPAASCLQEAMQQLSLNQQEGVGHPYPVRPGELDCPYYMRTGLCGFGALNSRVPGQFPDRPGQPECQGEKDCTFYLRTGSCKYGATCKYNHPPPLMPVPGSFVYPGPPVHVPRLYQAVAPILPSSRPPFHRSSRFESPPNPSPILTSPAQVSTAPWHSYQVSFLQQGFTGSYPHPALTSQEHLGVGLTPPLTPGLGSFILTFSAPSTPGHLEEGYPQRPGQQECSYYMKTGVCKFGWQCKQAPWLSLCAEI